MGGVGDERGWGKVVCFEDGFGHFGTVTEVGVGRMWWWWRVVMLSAGVEV